VRYGFHMLRPTSMPLSEAPMPPGLEVRPVREEDVRKVMFAGDEAFRDHWGHTPLTDDVVQRWMEDPTLDSSLWKVAWEDDEPAGAVQNFVDRDENEAYGRKRGYTEGIWVRRPWRRRGLARALLTQSIQMFVDMGMEETCLGVDVQNPSGALRLYESLGYQVERRDKTYRKPLT